MDEKNDYNEFDNQNNPYSSSQQSNYYEQQISIINHSKINTDRVIIIHSRPITKIITINRVTMPIGNNSMFLTNSQAERVLQ